MRDFLRLIENQDVAHYGRDGIAFAIYRQKPGWLVVQVGPGDQPWRLHYTSSHHLLRDFPQFPDLKWVPILQEE